MARSSSHHSDRPPALRRWTPPVQDGDTGRLTCFRISLTFADFSLSPEDDVASYDLVSDVVIVTQRKDFHGVSLTPLM
ncbi:hypothetical protein Cob_v007498 [Colletotrichum orbiculare MAFF 240422]|uniref:Uncharacterized protein n=1 Tax=Colletotrichum orbiculare (strain 104-T / ATCC 96160 / CBS 514.97 / LARS 414 / MAFF 240422) TaxID=1213857 RepID=A0A484FN92_COLOR|nr:hypothetical protein Cob_v007498 [Colletotrichum orbiculare MAFF 240422]